ncbi:MAG: UDP-N-acetylmuramoyl-L-alanyl-D-glutamate--2,6-diaminopimelate ligase [Lachnospiraceae bacterium]|nr:UDP-N-acetylmuramoyl-L-alanyl-D-glutamate--2,6-diaminopimelate ligase [Lachnospiraceae bacterium]
MLLSELLERLDAAVISGDPDATEITGVVYDSRKAEKGSLFVCVEGANSDGHDYLADVAEKGAAAVLVRRGHALPDPLPAGLAVAAVSDTRIGLAYTSAAWFGYPAEKIPVIGITGTKGKTTTTYMIRSILMNAGYRVGLIGTIESIVGDRHLPAPNTTPESYLIHQYLREMIDAGADCAVMEVSSQALMLHRTAGIEFEIGVFTNLSPDHIGPNEHSSFEQYLECKSMLFRQCRLGIVNADDRWTDQVLRGHTCEVERYGIRSADADLRADNIRHVTGPGYLGMTFSVSGRMSLQVELELPGLFSVYNALTAIAVCEHFSIREENILTALRKARVKGRIEPVRVSDEFTLMIDYAHNAMALESLLKTLRDYESGRIVCLFGCGGNRSRDRRFEMGEVSGKWADFTIITSDNPRYEKPEDIIADIVTGISRTGGRYITIPDRKEAIRYAILNGKPGDIIVLAGKGHEDYQEICGKKYPMDERVLIGEILDEEALR